ncbi:MAG: 1,6-anhydro-N-acetylmuramyl-L-alanine amidase AmpD [Burkholderiaceae bacterium]
MTTPHDGGACEPGWRHGWWRGARRLASPNFNPRPDDAVVDTVVLHSISLPPGVYGGDEVERLFTNRLDWSAHPYFATIRGLEVSAHFFVRRDGEVLQFVSIVDRAWHAGRSSWDGREACNDFSIGVELEGLEGERFEAAQYDALARLLPAIDRERSIRHVVGHEHVAPGRKGDPGAGFDWPALARRLGWDLARIPFARSGGT